MARLGARLRRGACALAVAVALLATPAAGRASPALAGRPGDALAHSARGASLAAGEAAQAGAHRKILLFGLTARDKAAHAEQRDAMIEEEFNQLIKAEAIAEEAIEAAEEAGDFEEAELQEEALEELEEKVAEVAAAEESEAAHEQAAAAAMEAGDFETAKREQALAEEAQAEAELAEEDLADAVLAEQEIAEMSLRERMDPSLMFEAVGAYAPRVLDGAAGAVAVARSGVRTRLDAVLGEYPLLATLLEWLSLVLPVAILMAAFSQLRRDAQGAFSLRSEVLLFGHMYWAGYYGVLACATAALPAEPPLTAFARAQPEQYVSYQVFLMIAFLAYLALLGAHAAMERSMLSGLQLAGAAVVYLHSYLTVFHRAMKAALPPAHGGALWFALYAVIFTSMTFFIKRERKGKGD